MLSPSTTSAACPSGKVARKESLSAHWYQFMSIRLWGNLPSSLQRRISKTYSQLYDQAFSKHFIKPYCKLHYSEPDYLQQFVPPFGKTTFESFQDFFTREFKTMPKANSNWVWPCEGFLCHFGRVGHIPSSNVKGDIRSVANIFGVEEGQIPESYQFSNVFLHNKNYHRIHAPIKGSISRIQHIPGDLVVLRPWIYQQNPSIPAFRNERVNIDLIDDQGRTWYLSVIGGPAVGTIELPEAIEVGVEVDVLQELALFYLGSTCCMACPELGLNHKAGNLVWVGADY